MPSVDIISGKYGGFCAMVPMIRIMHEADWKLRVHLCDQHLEERWGCSWKDAEQVLPPKTVVLHDGFPATNRLTNLFRLGINLTCMWEHKRPDAVIVYGDRMDALIGATAAHQLQIPVAHLQAGDKSGCIDDETRDAVSRLSTWLFSPDEASHWRLDVRVFTQPTYNVGDHHIDALVDALHHTRRPSVTPPYLVVHMHPDTKQSREWNLVAATELSDALTKVGMNFVLIQPCNDLHYEALMTIRNNQYCVSRHQYLPHNEYVSLLLDSRGLVGNTSAVCIDAPYLCVKSLNIGNRQRGRGTHFKTAGYGRIEEAIREMLDGPGPEPYMERGTGEAGRKTFKILERKLA